MNNKRIIKIFLLDIVDGFWLICVVLDGLVLCYYNEFIKWEKVNYKYIFLVIKFNFGILSVFEFWFVWGSV